MFKKLISNLPFNPSLIEQVSFYAKRIHKESSVRRTGLFVLGLAMLVQMLAVFSPPQATMARSNNDIVNGGFVNRDQAVLHCLNNAEDFNKILEHYGITCTDVSNAETVRLGSNDYGKQLFSMGRLYYNLAGQQPVSISGTNSGQNLWLRYLWSWDTNGSSTYNALTGTTKNGLKFFILFNCGNLVFIGVPVPPVPPQPPPEIVKCPYNPNIANDSPDCKPCKDSQTRDDKTPCLVFHKKASNITQKIVDANNTTAKPSDVIEYTLSVENISSVSIKFGIQENLSDVLDYADIVNLNGGTVDKNGLASWPLQNIAGKSTVLQKITVRVKDPLPTTPVSSSDPGHFDLKMTNLFGDTVTINLPTPLGKQPEVIVSQLPNTGPGTSLAVGFVVTSIVGFFFARSRIMANELDAVRLDSTTSGGY